MGTLTPELERKLGAAVERMPGFPRSVQRVLELTRDINCLPKDLVGVIEKDPVMTMKILKVINSAYYALPNKITSVNQSVVYLGINTIKNLSLAVAAVGMLPRVNSAGFDIQRYLLHSLATAAAARQLCGVYGKGGADAGDCYVAGLLHDFGKVVFAQFMPSEFHEALLLAENKGLSLHQAEREVIGIDHGYVGAMLAAKWQFPAPLVACIRNHHAADAEASAMLDCLRVADQICRGDLDGERPADWFDQAPQAPARFGASLKPVIAALGNLDKIVAEARMFVSVDSGA